MSSIEDRVKEILIADLFVEIEKDDILLTHSFRQDLGIDSLGFVELREAVQTRFGITVSDDEFTPENFATIASLSRLIVRCGSATGAGS